jgi:heme/copper-type cytochrome/quinol oxidase subunit 2
MSPFLVYLLFQADSISDAMTFIAVMAGVAFVIALPLRLMAKSAADKDEGAAIAYRMCRVVMWVCPLLIAAGMFMPSSKTIAAMIVLPKITTPQAIDTMSKESRDIYDLAKKALANLADDKPAKAETK